MQQPGREHWRYGDTEGLRRAFVSTATLTGSGGVIPAQRTIGYNTLSIVIRLHCWLDGWLRLIPHCITLWCATASSPLPSPGWPARGWAPAPRSGGRGPCGGDARGSPARAEGQRRQECGQDANIRGHLARSRSPRPASKLSPSPSRPRALPPPPSAAAQLPRPPQRLPYLVFTELLPNTTPAALVRQTASLRPRIPDTHCGDSARNTVRPGFPDLVNLVCAQLLHQVPTPQLLPRPLGRQYLMDTPTLPLPRVYASLPPSHPCTTSCTTLVYYTGFTSPQALHRNLPSPHTTTTTTTTTTTDSRYCFPVPPPSPPPPALTSSRLSTTGSAKASVLPLPVLARHTTSRPLMMGSSTWGRGRGWGGGSWWD